jgi:predicted DNA-binding transcriptional regulator YafY
VPTDAAADAFEADVITVSARSMDELVSLVCGAGADVVVLEPEAVITAVVEALTGLATRHAGGPS